MPKTFLQECDAKQRLATRKRDSTLTRRRKSRSNFEDQMPCHSMFKLVKFLLDHISSDRESFITLV